MRISIKNKTGFETAAKAIAIYSEDFAPFYYMEAKQGKLIKFNLPAGVYFCEENIKQLPKPIEYKTPNLPKPEREFRHPEKPIEIIFRPNPNKCSIFLELGLIVAAPSINLKTRSEKMFVIYHELGHYMYKSEHLCDQYAVKRMLEEGYNPSQCVFSVNGCLSQHSQTRKDNIFNFAKKVKK